jgi:hypothetical protein
VILTQVTIAGNGLGAGGLTGDSAVPSRGGCCGERGLGAGIDTGGRYGTGSAVFGKNSIIADNGNSLAGGTNCHQHYYPTYIDIADQGGNVTWNDTTCPGKVADPMLGPFANNGGPTETLMPGEGGSAIGRSRPAPAPSIKTSAACRAQVRGRSIAMRERSRRRWPNPRPAKKKKAAAKNNLAVVVANSRVQGAEIVLRAAGQARARAAPARRRRRCRARNRSHCSAKKGFKKKTVKDKTKCVKMKKAHQHPKS